MGVKKTFSHSQILMLVDEHSKDLGLDDGYSKLLRDYESQQGVFEMIFHFAIRGLSSSAASEAIKKSAGNPRLMNDLLIEALWDRYIPTDRLQKRILDTEEKVKRAVLESKDIKDHLISEYDKVLKEKDSIIAENKEAIAALRSSIEELKKKTISEPITFTLFGRRQGKKKNEADISTKSIQRDSQAFLEEYVNSGEYSDEQIEFLADCLADGIPESDLKNFASPKVKIDVMKKLKSYYVSGLNSSDKK